MIYWGKWATGNLLPPIHVREPPTGRGTPVQTLSMRELNSPLLSLIGISIHRCVISTLHPHRSCSHFLVVIYQLPEVNGKPCTALCWTGSTNQRASNEWWQFYLILHQLWASLKRKACSLILKVEKVSRGIQPTQKLKTTLSALIPDPTLHTTVMMLCMCRIGWLQWSSLGSFHCFKLTVSLHYKEILCSFFHYE